jgi:hypothetical protein
VLQLVAEVGFFVGAGVGALVGDFVGTCNDVDWPHLTSRFIKYVVLVALVVVVVSVGV